MLVTLKLLAVVSRKTKEHALGLVNIYICHLQVIVHSIHNRLRNHCHMTWGCLGKSGPYANKNNINVECLF